jgi:rfaE bifunctional protein kinase chain/domain
MNDYIPLPRLHEILAAAAELRVGVVGDFTLDGYWTVDMTRSTLSRETPLFPRPVIKERYSCGGAANTAWNLAALGLSEVRAFTVLGADWRGDLLRQTLIDARVDPRDGLVDTAWKTPLFGKVLLTAGNMQQEDARLDFINTTPLSVESEAALIERIEAALPNLDALVIADYHSVGVVTPQVLEALNDMAGSNPQVLFTVDSRERVGQFEGMVRKPNQLEAARWLFPERSPDLIGVEEFASKALHPHVDCGCPLFITMGERGCLVLSGGESHLVPAVRVSGPVDPVGAGDSFLAALTAALAAGADPLEAAQLAHLAAAVTVQKLGITGTAAAEEIIRLAETIL